MKFLLTNDDGIDAPGLEALVSVARTLGEPIVVAPAGPQSGVSHAVTWREGVRIEPRGESQPATVRPGPIRDSRHAGRLHPPRIAPPGSRREMGLKRDQPRRKSRRRYVLFRHGGRGSGSRAARLARCGRVTLSQIWCRLRLAACGEMGDANPDRDIGETDRGRPVLQCEPADSSSRSGRPGSRLVFARSKPVAAQLSPRRRERSLLRRRLPTPPSHTAERT